MEYAEEHRTAYILTRDQHLFMGVGRYQIMSTDILSVIQKKAYMPM